MSLENKTVIVTGGGAGIGRAIAESFSVAGAMVHICDVLPDRVAQMIRPERGWGATLADVRNEAEVERLFEEALARFDGRLDILINNAGSSGPTGPIETMSLAEWDDTFQTNVRGAFLMLRHALPPMKAAGAGAIVNIAATAGTFGYPLRAPYAAAKWAIVGLTKTLAMELGPAGIRVNAICPGSVSGPRMDKLIDVEAAARDATPSAVRSGYVNQVSLRTFVESEDIAEAVVFLCSDKAARISGQILAVDGNTEILATMAL